MTVTLNKLNLYLNKLNLYLNKLNLIERQKIKTP
jgi:hypothetical protein